MLFHNKDKSADWNLKEEKMKIKDFFEDIVSQNRERLASYFCEDARIYWHCTNEEFTLAE